MSGDTMIACTEDGVDAIVAGDRGATRAGDAFITRECGIVKIITAGTLEHVAAGSGHIAKLGRGAREKGFGQYGKAFLYLGVPGEVAILYEGAYADTAVGVGVDLFEVEVIDIDEDGGLFDIEFHEIDYVGAACDVSGVFAAGVFDGGGLVG